MSNTALAASASHADASLTVRIPGHMLDAIERKRMAMQGKVPGVAITTSDAVRALLLVGLAAES